MIDSLSRLWTDQIFLSVRLPSSSEFLFCWTPKHRNVRIIPSVPHTSSENFSTLELLFVHIYPCPSLPVRSDGEHEEVHGQGTNGASNGDRPHPGKDDVPEELPVHVLFGPDTPHRHHRANLTVGGANRDPHVGCQKNSQSRTNLNAEPTENRTQLCYYQTEAYPEHSIHSCCIPTFWDSLNTANISCQEPVIKYLCVLLFR